MYKQSINSLIVGHIPKLKGSNPPTTSGPGGKVERKNIVLFIVNNEDRILVKEVNNVFKLLVQLQRLV